MSEVTTIALITAASGAVGVVGGVVTSLFAPVLLESRRADRESRKQHDARRSDSLHAFTHALAAMASPAKAQSVLRKELRSTRAELVMTLERGEEAVQEYSLGLMRIVMATNEWAERSEAYADYGTDQLLRWVRGEVVASDLRPFSVLRHPTHGIPEIIPVGDWQEAEGMPAGAST